MGISREESFEKMMAQIERCVKHQNQQIALPLPPSAPWEWVAPGEVLPEMEMGNGAGIVPCDNESLTPVDPAYTYFG